jgi:glycine betaine/choline ABC-type transport system substrate-binding protein
MKPATAALFATLLLVACKQSPDRAPVTLGSRAEHAGLAERVARKLEQGGCRVQRQFDLASAIVAHDALEAGRIDATLESQRVALVEVLKLPVPQSLTIENVLRPQYVNRGLLWSPPLGRGDLAVVFRKDIDRKCREATRALMRVAYLAEAPS